MSIGYLATSLWNGIGPTIQNGWEQAGASWNGVQKTVSDVNESFSAAGSLYKLASDTLNTVRKYWYVPVIIGGVIIGYKLVKRANPAALSASAIRALAAANQ